MKQRLGKVSCILLTFVLLLFTAACGGTDTAPAPSSGDAAGTASPEASTDAGDGGDSSGGSIVIGMSHFNVGANNYTTSYTDALNKHLQENYPDVKLVLLDAQGDATTQLDQIGDLIEQKVDVAIVWPVSSTGIIPGLESLQAAGIPVINTNSGVDASGADLITAFSGPSDYTQGNQAGEAMIEALGGSGKVVELSGMAGYDTAIQRSNGFADAIEGSDIEILESQPTDWSTDKAQTIMETYIAKYGDEIDGIYCADDGIATGAMNALDAVGQNDGRYPITSCTMFASGYEAVKEGKQYASVLQSPILDAQLALELAVQVGQGQTIAYDNRIETFIVDQKNVDTFDRPTW